MPILTYSVCVCVYMYLLQKGKITAELKERKELQCGLCFPHIITLS